MDMFPNEKVGYNTNLKTQMLLLESILMKNTYLWEVLERISTLDNNTMYLASGSISQTVWNYQNKNIPDLMYGISDFDIVYFDDDTSYEKEDEMIKKVAELTNDIPVSIDVKNQARVHLWANDKWGCHLKPYTSVQEAISSWSSTASCIGVRIYKDYFSVFAPYGLNDTFGQIVREINSGMPRCVFKKKVEKWKKQWDFLTIIPLDAVSENTNIIEKEY